jgi:hypothetical protein
MPSGYTACIEQGITFEQFVMQCARAMGALISMRDDSIDTPIPDKIEPNLYYKEQVFEKTKKLEELRLMTLGQASVKANEEYDRELIEHHEAIKNHDELRLKYQNMIQQVQNWQPPTKDHEGLKKFMLEQLQSSMDSDCDNSYYFKHIPVKLSANEWYNAALSGAEDDLRYYQQKYDEELKQCQEATKWVRDLRYSLKPKPERPMRALEL